MNNKLDGAQKENEEEMRGQAQKHRGRNVHDVFLKGTVSPGDGVGKKVGQGELCSQIMSEELGL